MVVLGFFFIAVCAWGTFQLVRKKLWANRWFLKSLPWIIPLPIAACQFGWTAAEVGRQPWVVYGLLKTEDAVSVTVGATPILISMILVCSLYLALFCLWIYVSFRIVKGSSRNEESAPKGPTWI